MNYDEFARILREYLIEDVVIRYMWSKRPRRTKLSEPALRYAAERFNMSLKQHQKHGDH